MYELISTDTFRNQIKNLDHSAQVIIEKCLDKNLINTSNTRIHGKQFAGNLSKCWKCTIGDHRLFGETDSVQMIIVAIEIGN